MHLASALCSGGQVTVRVWSQLESGVRSQQCANLLTETPPRQMVEYLDRIKV